MQRNGCCPLWLNNSQHLFYEGALCLRHFSKTASRCTTYCFIATGVYSFGIYVLNSVCVHLFGTGVWVIMGNILCVCYGHNRHQLSFQIQLVILPFLITVRCREAATCRYCFYSVAKKTVAEKLWIRSKNGWHLLGWPRRALSPCKVWGRSYNARRL